MEQEWVNKDIKREMELLKLEEETTSFIVGMIYDTFEAIKNEDYERAMVLKITKDNVLKHQSNVYSKILNKNSEYFLKEFEYCFSSGLENLIKLYKE